MKIEKIEIKCKSCGSAAITKKGIKKKKLQSAQRYLCKDCRAVFTLESIGKTYPISIILKSISAYNLGCTLKQTQEKIEKYEKIKVPVSTLNSWINESKNICAYSKLRKQAIKIFSPKSIIKKLTLSHIQPYTFKCHKAKLHLLFHSRLYNNEFHNIAHFYEPLKAYLEKIGIDKFPHHIFTYDKTKAGSPNAEVDIKNFENNQMEKIKATSVGDNAEKSASNPDAGAAQKSDLIDNENKPINLQNRASQIKFNHLKIKINSKNNFACKLAKLALNLATSNKDRHQAIQDFFLMNDSTTIAVEVPVYLTNWDAGYYRNQKGFIFPLSSYKTPITGHIDLLQIRNGIIHILDYKPSADKIQPAEQLTIYALALSRKLNLSLYYFKCAWFDESSCFEFFPLHAVYKLKKKDWFDRSQQKLKACDLKNMK